MEIPTKQWKILLVEDSPHIRAVLAQTLELENYIVHQAEDGLVALNKLQNFTPDLILSDINMPNMDGITFYKELRKIPRLIQVPFIFLTANDRPEDIQTGKVLGVEDYLTKPIDPDDLLGIVNARLLRTADVQLALVNQAYLETVTVLANTIEGRDPYTHGHVDRVMSYAKLLATTIGWPHDQVRLLEFGALLHDIGKIIVPDQVLKKPDKLDPEEWHLMRQHPVAGAKILEDISHLREIIPYVLYHHEQWDGKGYPHGLAGRDIPIQARVMKLVDVYDALTTTRPYHPARPHHEVVQYLHYQSGKQFDPELVPIFINAMNKLLAKSTATRGH